MNQDSIIADIEQRAWSVGVSINRLCLKAGVNPSTFSRWKRSERNPEPVSATLHSIAKLYDALNHFEARKPRRARKAVAA